MKIDNTLKFVMYCRKSSEDDRQAASIGDQLRELMPVVTREKLNVVAEPFKEEKSAKAPGRPTFNDMIGRIERGDANAIICWDIDRLYRNPVDEGRVRWLLQRSILREIRTPHRTFYPQDAGLLMGVEGGRATDHIITLRKGVFRGMRGKLEKGHRPGVAPPGYLNDTTKERGERDIIPDPQRFALIRQAWDLMLTGRYSVRQIYHIADNEWKLRSRKTKRLGGRPYAHSTWYRIFTDPFYAGSFWWKEPETDTLKLYPGSHKPMITLPEFDRVQAFLGNKGKPAPKTHRFPFTGLIRCGECNSMVTAEAKYQIICQACKHKFSALNRELCPRCHIPIDNMESPVRLYYTYYHCTKPRHLRCFQKSVRAERMEDLIDEVLATITISDEFKKWAIKALQEDDVTNSNTQRTVQQSIHKHHNEVRRQLQHINRMILSPDTDWALISRDEIKEQKILLVNQLQAIEQQLATSTDHERSWLELSRNTFEFAAYARLWFKEGGLTEKRAILAALGSNLILKDKKLMLELKKPLSYIADMAKAVHAASRPLEPKKSGSTKRQKRALTPSSPSLRRGKNAIRTYWETSGDLTPFPLFGS